MSNYNYAKIKAIENANKDRIKKQCPDVPETPGIYFLTREENGFKFAYIGQAKHLLTRLAQHLNGYQHIDLSIKKHKLWSAENPCGWRVQFTTCNENELDELERNFIRQFADNGYQLLNKTDGGQGEGKASISPPKTPRGYYDGLKQGYRNAQKEVSYLFDKHLTFSTKKDPPTVHQQKAMEKFNAFLDYE